MDKANVFKTKTGYCHILPDKIVLSRDGVIGNVSSALVGNNINRVLFFYALLVIGNLFAAYMHFKKNEIYSTLFFLIAGLFLLYGILASRNNSATPIINRTSIKKVKFTKGMGWLTRSRFEVLFENEQGKLKKRLIMLPGTLNNAKEETTKALQIMKTNNLLLTE